MSVGEKPSVGARPARARTHQVAAPVAMAHLGVGNFFRAHQAWYTSRARDTAQWGIAAFTGRNPEVARTLTAQDGLYTLIVRGPEGDRPELISALSRVHAGTDSAAWLATVASPNVRVVTTTVTEAGYRRAPDGTLDVNDPHIRADIAIVRAGTHSRRGADATVDLEAATTAPGKLVAGLAARMRADAGPVTLMACDNVPDNGAMLGRIVGAFADEVDPALAGWVLDHVRFATTMVDRITPRTTAEDQAQLLRTTGIDDPACVVTEPFSEWVIGGDFAAGRPQWETAGVRFVTDIEPWERRKLYLLNGSHSLMAYAAPLRGATTVAEAVADDVMLGWVEEWWDDAAAALSLPTAAISDYRNALLERYRNPRIRHQLAQIAADGSQKMPIRILPALHHARRSGRVPLGATRVIAAWTLHVQGHGVEMTDAAAAGLRESITGRSPARAARAVLSHLGVEDAEILAATTAHIEEMRAG